MIVKLFKLTGEQQVSECQSFATEGLFLLINNGPFQGHLRLVIDRIIFDFAAVYDDTVRCNDDAAAGYAKATAVEIAHDNFINDLEHFEDQLYLKVEIWDGATCLFSATTDAQKMAAFKGDLKQYEEQLDQKREQHKLAIAAEIAANTPSKSSPQPNTWGSCICCYVMMSIVFISIITYFYVN